MMDLGVGAFSEYLSLTRPQSTVTTYNVAARHLIEYCRKFRVDIHKTPGLLLGFTAYLLKERDLKPKSLEVMIPGVVKYLEWRRAHGDPLPVFARPERPKDHREPPVILKAAAMRQFIHLSLAEAEPFRTAALTLPFTGLRASELCNMRLNQVIRDAGDPQQLMFRRVEGKSKSIRDVKILKPGSAILFAYLIGWRRGVSDSPWLFPSDKNWAKPYVGRTLRRRMGHIERALGQGLKVSARVIRHTWTTALADHGVPMHHLAQMAGHEDIQTTYKYYIGNADPKKLADEISQVMLYEED